MVIKEIFFLNLSFAVTIKKELCYYWVLVLPIALSNRSSWVLTSRRLPPCILMTQYFRFKNSFFKCLKQLEQLVTWRQHGTKGKKVLHHDKRFVIISLYCKMFFCFHFQFLTNCQDLYLDVTMTLQYNTIQYYISVQLKRVVRV